MQFTRTLKQGMTGEDVFYIKQKLFELGYYEKSIKEIKSKSFGRDTVVAVKNFQAGQILLDKPFVINGIINKEVWGAIERESLAPKKITFTRNLKLGMSGEDVRYMKDCLFELGYYSVSITSIKNNRFGEDTLFAVNAFQRKNGLVIDGIIGKKTWPAIESAFNNNEKAPEKIKLLKNYSHIAEDKREAIEKDLETASEIRKDICLEILNYAYDKDIEGLPRALYVFGANLYNTERKINYADKKEIESLSAQYPGYFSNGRKEWMLQQIKQNAELPAADCSGMEVGYLRKHKLVSSSFDATANGLCGKEHSKEIDKKNLIPGDWVGREGHIGTYVGGGYVVEFYGGAFTCQLTKLDNREGYDFIAKKVTKGSAWTKFRKPKYY